MMLPQMRYRAPGMSEREWRDGDLRYRRFLARQRGRQDELFTYFANDFFHDGPIERIRIKPDRQEVSFRIQASWIVPKDADEERQVGTVAAWFRCVFYDVVWYSLGTVPFARCDPFQGGGGEDEYLYSEINTLTSHLRQYRHAYRRYLRETERDFRSLTVMLGRQGRMLALVFTRLEVIAEEPIAWSRLVTRDADNTGLYQRAGEEKRTKRPAGRR